MRITTFLLLVCVFCTFAENTHSQNARVSINKKNVQLETVLNEIEHQTVYLQQPGKRKQEGVVKG